MGYLDAFPTATPPVPGALPSADAATPPPPTRTARDRCWAARDAFFACLDANGIVDSVKDPEGVRMAAAKCSREDAVLGTECASSWAKYFKERRVMEHKKNRMLQSLEAEGARPIEGTLPQGMAGAAAK